MASPMRRIFRRFNISHLRRSLKKSEVSTELLKIPEVSSQDLSRLHTHSFFKRSTCYKVAGGLIVGSAGFLVYVAKRYLTHDDAYLGERPICSVIASHFLPRVDAAKVIDGASGDSVGVNEGLPLSRSQKFNFIADVVEKTAPAVVYIEIQGRHPMFGHNVTLSNGSGFIVQEDGLVLTNAHVVANKNMVMVKLYDGRVFNGYVEDIDSISDLATIRIKCRNLPILKLGCSNSLRPGEWVVAMGSPLSLSNTITTGVISSVHRGSRELGIHHKNMEYIQTDASINFGNSGGPLVNLDGEAIGINTMKVTAGISFAIPVDYAKEFLKTSAEKQKQSGWFGGQSVPPPVRRRYMGITMLTLTPSLILELQQRQPEFPDEVTHGVMVWKVVIGSPAYKGGLMPGDIITHINSKEALSARDINQALDSQSDLKLHIIRKRHKMTLTVLPEISD